jgi:hypothetical protein
MKIVIKSIVFAVLIHLVYFAGMLGYGYYQTLIYKPESAGNTAGLHNEVTFGGYTNPSYFVLTFIAAAVLCGMYLLVSKRFFSRTL